MENLDKYVFDPANPRQCKVYDYLVTLLATRQMSAFIAPYYFIEIYKDHLLTPTEKAELWDVPDNMNELNGVEQFEVYRKNFGLNDLQRKIKKKDFSAQKIFTKLFTKFLSYQTFDEDSYNMKLTPKIAHSIEVANVYGELPPFYSIEDVGYDGPQFDFFVYQITEMVVFLDHLNFDAIKECPVTSSFLITTLADFQEGEKMLKALQNGDLKPLLLRDITDIHILLDYLYKDVEQKKAQLQATSAQNTAEQFGYLDTLTVQNYLTLSTLQLSGLGECKEIYFLGENGDGKTVILQAISLALLGDTKSVGLAEAIAQMRLQNPDMALSATDNLGKTYTFGQDELHPFLYGYGVNRFRNDSDKKAEYAHQTLFDDDCYLENPVKWLQYLDYAELKDLKTPIGKLQAVELLREILDRDQHFTVEINPNSVIFYEQNQALPFEHLSHGYKSVITWVADLLTRLAKQQPHAISTHDFTGIVLIDEVDLFLHPKWQRQVVRRLRHWFSGLQFIITTHSPIVVLGASNDALFYKIYRQQAQTQISEAYTAADLVTLMANGIITSPLFDLDTAKMDAATAQTNISTRDTYLHDRIFIAIDAELKERKKAGINYVSQQQITEMIQKALAKQTQPK
jgi:predicted ATPase